MAGRGRKFFRALPYAGFPAQGRAAFLHNAKYRENDKGMGFGEHRPPSVYTMFRQAFVPGAFFRFWKGCSRCLPHLRRLLRRRPVFPLPARQFFHRIPI